MNNQNIGYNPISFSSEREARKYCLSSECEAHISSLHGQVASLIDSSRTEVPYVMGHGYPAETESGHLASYIGAEASRLSQMQDYFKGKPARPGFTWVWNSHGNQSVGQTVDLRSPTTDHPVFNDWLEGRKLSKKEKKIKFDFWLSKMTSTKTGVGALNDMFALTYHFKLDDLIPKDIKLVDYIKKKR